MGLCAVCLILLVSGARVIRQCVDETEYGRGSGGYVIVDKGMYEYLRKPIG